MPSLFTGTTADLSTDDSIEIEGPTSGTAWSAQSVELGAWTIDSVVMRVTRQGTVSDNFVVSLEADASNEPSGSPLASDSIVGSTINNVAMASSAFYIFDLGYTVTAGKYWIVCKRSGSTDAANDYAIPLLSTNPYPDGALGFYNGATTTWTPSAFGGVYDVCTELQYSGVAGVGPLAPSDLHLNDGTAMYGGTGVEEAGAQTVQLFTGTTVTYVKFQGYRTGTLTDNVTVSIQADSAGSPSGSTLASGSMAGSSVGSTGNSWNTIAISGGWAVPSTGLYWLLFQRSSGSRDTSNYCVLQCSASSGKAYSEGDFYIRNSGSWGSPYNSGNSVAAVEVLYTGATSIGQRGWQYVSEAAVYGATGTDQRAAQTVVLPACRVLSTRVYGSNNAAPTDNLVMAFQLDAAGAPSGTDLSAVSLNVTGFANITSQGAYYNFDHDVALAAGTYWLVVRRSGSRDTTNYFLLVETAAGYTDGAAYSDNSGTWNVEGLDLNFEVVYRLTGGPTPIPRIGPDRRAGN